MGAKSCQNTPGHMQRTTDGGGGRDRPMRASSARAGRMWISSATFPDRPVAQVAPGFASNTQKGRREPHRRDTPGICTWPSGRAGHRTSWEGCNFGIRARGTRTGLLPGRMCGRRRGFRTHTGWSYNTPYIHKAKATFKRASFLQNNCLRRRNASRTSIPTSRGLCRHVGSTTKRQRNLIQNAYGEKCYTISCPLHEVCTPCIECLRTHLFFCLG